METFRPINPNLQKAKVTNLETNVSVDCLFNPNQYTLTKTNNWNVEPQMGKDLGEFKFVSGDAMTLAMTLFFDTFNDQSDVRAYTDKLLELTYVDPSLKKDSTDKGRPPRCMFTWGRMWGFKAVISSMTLNFTLFLEDGTPVRATVVINFTQVEQQGVPKPQNPTSRGEAGRRLRIVCAGERLDWIAYQEYGDPTRWRLIAQANGLIDPLALTPGMQLVIPTRS